MHRVEDDQLILVGRQVRFRIEPFRTVRAWTRGRGRSRADCRLSRLADVLWPEQRHCCRGLKPTDEASAKMSLDHPCFCGAELHDCEVICLDSPKSFDAVAGQGLVWSALNAVEDAGQVLDVLSGGQRVGVIGGSLQSRPDLCDGLKAKATA